MKNLISEVVFGKNIRLNLILVLSIAALVGLGCSGGVDYGNLSKGGNNSNSAPPETNVGSTDSAAPNEPAPPDDEVIRLARETTVQFGNAVSSGDFAAIHSGASPDFQKTYSVEQMTSAFKSYTDQKDVVSPILGAAQDADVEFAKPPFIRSEKGLKILVASGKFATKPHTVRFDYEYVNRDGQWKLLKLVVNIP
jgi:hypothetical protein